MDREHPIPQDVAAYEFRLVGDMTIKQFMQVAAGALISLLVYSSNLAPYVKWPIIIISFLAGIALAFFPIEDRPLSKWIILFVKAIYSPTVYVWNKNARKYDFFSPENVVLPPQQNLSEMKNITPSDQVSTDLPQTLSSISPVADDSAGLEKKEQEFLNKVNIQFNAPATPTTVPLKEAVKVEIPQNQTVKIEAQEKPIQPYIQGNTTTYGGQVTPMAMQDLSQAKSAVFSDNASPPSPPSRPNIVVGQVMDPAGKIIDGAILEIKDSEGRSVRALRSNRLGHFMIVTPLVNGQYRIATEKEGYIFEPVSFEAKDQIIPPIAIWAKQ